MLNKYAFTLVELIVVVTILAILATIGFVSYSGYLKGVRDTNRIASLTAISDGLELYRTKNDLPDPDDAIDIQVEGVDIAHQGYVGSNVLQTIEYSKAGKDPKDDSYYSYYLTDDKKHYQLMALLEKSDNLDTHNITSTSHAASNYKKRSPKVYGKKLGILTDADNTPVQEVITGMLNFTGGTTTSYTARFTDSDILEGGGSILKFISVVASCQRIKQLKGSSKTGVYSINPSGTGAFDVYCDMTTDGGGWTLIYNQEWSDDEKIVGNLDVTVGIVDIGSEHRINPSDIFLGDQKEIRIQQDDRWIIVGDIDINIFQEMFNENASHGRDLEIVNSSTGFKGNYMDQDSHSVNFGVYQWNIINLNGYNAQTCFEYSKTGTDINHEWIVYPDCDGAYSLTSGVSYPRRALIYVR